jgi:predicted DNA-binding transcriptional regulator AlpA
MTEQESSGAGQVWLGQEKMFTAQGVAEAVGIPYRQLWTRVSRGTLPSADVNLGKKPLWKASTIETWLADRQLNGNEE